VSRNLATSTCVTEGCPRSGQPVRLTDLIGKPLEARRHGPYAPTVGVRYDCPGCGTAYFAWVRHYDTFWSRPYDADKPVNAAGHSNLEQGRFVTPDRREQTGCFVVDLSYWSTFNDECYDEDERAGRIEGPPAHTLDGDAADVQWVW
jgi:hypothetical protein